MHAATRKTLLKVKGFSEVKVEKIKEAIVKCQVSENALEDTTRCHILLPCFREMILIVNVEEAIRLRLHHGC